LDLKTYLLYIVGIYILVINITGFASMGVDKYKAKNRLWRIKEATLFMYAIIGGSVGSILGMYVFHHKTKHTKFVVGMPLVLVAQILIAAFIYKFKAG
jgi:uncharacterized membrane protein YsdA (DUF1294 family)